MSRRRPPPATGASAPPRLEDADRAGMLLAERDRAIAQAAVARFQHGLEVGRLRAELAARIAAGELAEAAAQLAAADAAHQRVVQDIARRYALDWHRTAFVPETGELVPLQET